MNHGIRLYTEFLDNSAPIDSYRFDDAERALYMLCVNSETRELDGFRNVKDCGFLCVDDQGRDHCRMIVGTNLDGREVVATLCDRC